jgi:hypothetical protein
LIISYECGTPFCPRRFSIDGIPTTGDDAKSDTNSNSNADDTDRNNNHNHKVLLLFLVAAGATPPRYRNKYYSSSILLPRDWFFNNNTDGHKRLMPRVVYSVDVVDEVRG